MEAATIVAAAVALKLRPFPLLTFLSLDLAALLIGSHGPIAFEQKQQITLLFGATVLGVTSGRSACTPTSATWPSTCSGTPCSSRRH